MTVLDRITSAMRFLTPAQRAANAPTSSERAAAELARRMNVRLPA